MDDELALAIDIGGTKLEAGLVTSGGEIVVRHREATDASSAEALYAQVVRLAVAARSGGEPVVCGVGCGGPARQRHRLLSPLNIAVWRDFPLQARLSADLGLAVHVDNDAKALTLAEGWRGAAQGVADYIGIVVSTGLGGGIVSNGRLLEGADGNAGHIGHVFVEPGGHADGNGVAGLAEGSASGTGIARATGRPAAEADPAMRRQVGIWVGRAVASVMNLLDLQLAVVGGGVALGYGDDFFDAAQRTIDDLCRVQHSRGARIVAAQLGDDAPLVGAAAVGWRGAGALVLGPEGVGILHGHP